jgi:F420-0:gamma-glutamyl ligase-like protein
MISTSQEKLSVISRYKETFLRIPVRTHEIKPPDQLEEVLRRYTHSLLQKGDIVVLSEKMVAAAQGRLVVTETIRPSRLAVFLAKNVKKTSHGIGLGSPESMQVAIWECGKLRILLAAVFGMIGKWVGLKGLFYRIAGRQAAWIDGDAPYGMLRGNITLGPSQPNQVCRQLAKKLNCQVAIMDVNDIGGCEICGVSPGCDRKLLVDVMKDNPLGQDVEQTPIGILRFLSEHTPCFFSSG